MLGSTLNAMLGSTLNGMLGSTLNGILGSTLNPNNSAVVRQSNLYRKKFYQVL